MPVVRLNPQFFLFPLHWDPYACCWYNLVAEKLAYKKVANLVGHGEVSELQKFEVGLLLVETIPAKLKVKLELPIISDCMLLQAAQSNCAWCWKHPEAVSSRRTLEAVIQ